MPHEVIPHLLNGPLTTDSRSFPGDERALLNQKYASLELIATNSGTPNPSPPSVRAALAEEHTSSRASSIHDLLNPASIERERQSPAARSCASFDGLDSAAVSDDHNNDNNQKVLADQEAVFGDDYCQPTAASSHDKGYTQNPCEQSKKRPFTELDRHNGTGVRSSLGSGPFPSTVDCQSNVRLSISLDGSVKVKLSDEGTPSPPIDRNLPSKMASKVLRKSQSAITIKDLEEQQGNTVARAAGGTFGRSRDSRTWEFYCDSEARDSLALQAERERSGSATSAISLIRSQSQSKRNSVGQRRALTSKACGGNAGKTEVGHSKPKVAGAMFSFAHIQGNTNVKRTQQRPGDSEMGGKCNMLSHRRSLSSDSDKENRAPGTRSSNNLFRCDPSTSIAQPRAVLKENRHIPSQARTINIGSRRKCIRGSDPAVFLDKTNRDDSEEGDDDDAIAFMNGGGSKGEDLDCVQGLLSLSQGAWR